jgi:acetyltransferase-like isoleucine patch superfamily enzyme
MDSFFKNITENYDKTCSLFDLKGNCLTFSREKKYLKLLKDTNYRLGVVVYKNILPVDDIPNNIELIPIDGGINIDYYFTLIHNFINKDKEPEPNKVGKNCNIHPSVILNVPGNTYAMGPAGDRVMLKHMGNVIIGNNVDIAAYSIVHTSTMSSTIIKDGVKVCAMCNLGHNCFIDENTWMGPGVRVAGGSKIGKNCYIWSGALIADCISICDNVTIGIGSVVIKSIMKPGVYYGNPCTYKKPYEGLKKTLQEC